MPAVADVDVESDDEIAVLAGYVVILRGQRIGWHARCAAITAPILSRCVHLALHQVTDMCTKV